MKNMKFVWMVLLVLCASASLALADAAFSVNWNAPLNDTTNTSRTITVGYTPWWNDVETVNCTLDINDEAYMIVNQTPLINDTLNEITYTYPADGYYKNFISCWNGSTGHSSEITYFYINTTELTDCAVLDTEGATYYLTAGITGTNDSQICLDVGADNITIDCQGYTIDGVLSRAIGTTYPYTVIKNCIIDGTSIISDVIYFGGLTSGDYGIVQNTSIISPDSQFGIYLRGVHDCLIINNTITGFGGVNVGYSYNNSITNNTIDTSNVGIFSNLDSPDNNFTSNTITTDLGIYIGDLSSGDRITGNNITASVWIEDDDLSDPDADFFNTTISGNIYYAPATSCSGTSFLGCEEIINETECGEHQACFWDGECLQGFDGNCTVIPTEEDCIEMGEGCVWIGTPSWDFCDITASSGNWADGGTERPFNATTPCLQYGEGYSYWLGSGNDWHPYTLNGEVPGGNSTNITDCTTLDIPNHEYDLTADIESSDAYVCMDFEDNNITLNCEGHTISGDGETGEIGIWISAVTGAVVRNCVITDWLTANIHSVGTMTGQVYNNTIEYGYEDGIAIYYPDDLIIHDNFIVYNYYGISIYDGDEGSWIYNNYFNNNFNVWLDSDGYNDWNTTEQAGVRIFEQGPNIGGNYWSGNGTCTGTATPCEILNQTDCNNQLGCVWFEDGESYCMNASPFGPAPCWYFAGGEGGGEVPCNLQLGCSWEIGGYSDFCADANHDGFCDAPLDLYTESTCTAGVDCGNNVDYLPLSGNYSGTPPTPGTFGGISCTVMELVVILSTLAIVIILAVLAYGGQANPALAMLIVIPMLVVLVIAIMQLVGTVC
jgi:hypothetical protein